MAVVSMKALLEAGVHFGHQTRRWNPKMKPYIFTERNGIYILDLQRTLRELDAAYRFVRDLTASRRVRAVRRHQEAGAGAHPHRGRARGPAVRQPALARRHAHQLGDHPQAHRAPRPSSSAWRRTARWPSCPKKEQLQLRAELEKLEKNLSGIRDMNALPGAVFIVDTKRETIAVAEARRLRIPIIGIVDTNCDPDEVDFVIPGNDDAIRSVSLICSVIARAAEEGKAAFEGPKVAGEQPEAPKVVADAEAPRRPPRPHRAAAEAPAAAAEAPAEEAVADGRRRAPTRPASPSPQAHGRRRRGRGARGPDRGRVAPRAAASRDATGTAYDVRSARGADARRAWRNVDG